MTPIINMLVGFFSGLATGAGVVISQFFGAKNGPMLHKAVHTTLIMTVILGVIFTFVGIFMTPMMLNLMSTPDDVFEGAALYLRIYFGGVLGLMIYNMGFGHPAGGGRLASRPLCLPSDRLLRCPTSCWTWRSWPDLRYGGSRAWPIATIIAQFASAVLVLVVLARSDDRLPASSGGKSA